MNTIHVEDLCLAVWHLIQYGEQGHVYNIVDKSDTSKSYSSCQISLSSESVGRTNFGIGKSIFVPPI